MKNVDENYRVKNERLVVDSTRDRIYKYTPGRISVEHFQICGGGGALRTTPISYSAKVCKEKSCFKWMFTIFMHALPWALNSRGSRKFSTWNKVKAFLNRSYVEFMQFEIGLPKTDSFYNNNGWMIFQGICSMNDFFSNLLGASHWAQW